MELSFYYRPFHEPHSLLPVDWPLLTGHVSAPRMASSSHPINARWRWSLITVLLGSRLVLAAIPHAGEDEQQIRGG